MGNPWDSIKDFGEDAIKLATAPITAPTAMALDAIGVTDRATRDVLPSFLTPEHVGSGQNRAFNPTASSPFQGFSQGFLSDALENIFKSFSENPENARDVFGSIPEAVLYDPVDLTESLLRTISGNAEALPEATELAGEINRGITDQALERINKLYPGFAKTGGNLSDAALALSAGQLPFEDVMDIVSDRSSLAANLGTPGGSRPATLRDLGLSRLEAIREGNSMFQNMIASAEQVDPITRHSVSADYLLDPTTRLNADIMQQQLVQQSEQGAANLAAMPDPVSRGLAQLEILKGANLSNIAAYNPFANWMSGDQYAGYLQGSGSNLPG